MEYFLAIGLAAVATWLGWRYFRLCSAVGELTEIVSGDELPVSSDLPEVVTNQPLAADLSRAVLDGIAEASLGRDYEARNREFLEALLNEIEDAIFVLAEGLEVRFSNQAATLLFPSDQPHAGRSLMQVCLDHRVVDAVELAIEVGGKIQDRFLKRTTDENDQSIERTYLIEAEPLSAPGNEGGAWVLIRDITLQLETEQIRQDFVANASHELRTPLSIINGYLEMLDEGDYTANSDVFRRCISTMHKHSERISRIVEDMLTISKLESDRVETLKHERFDIGDCIEGIIEHLHPLIEENRAKVKVDLPKSKSERELEGDRFYWDQIFFNLIENAPQAESQARVEIENRGRHGEWQDPNRDLRQWHRDSRHGHSPHLQALLPCSERPRSDDQGNGTRPVDRQARGGSASWHHQRPQASRVEKRPSRSRFPGPTGFDRTRLRSRRRGLLDRRRGVELLSGNFLEQFLDDLPVGLAVDPGVVFENNSML